ncbi:hypothetical protein [Paractinoplanes deccanensis]|uniref:hypothetical protein n=1 Tax=Paractinoplanes deccanensis TaxID=113561 RepID=UPI001EF23A54|nr:hypothetical protein [Actinoplanes deccanensis]
MLIVAPIAAGTAVVAAKRRSGRSPSPRRTHVVTVHRPLSEIPGSLEELAKSVEISLAPAPGDRGTEISVRIPEGSPVTDAEVRRALRETRSLVEVGDVLLPSGPPTTEKTPLNRPLRTATEHGREGGLL